MSQYAEVPQPGFSPLFRFLVPAVLSVLCLGGYSVGVYVAAVESGTPMALGVGLFGSPFAVIGVVMLWSAGVNFLTLFNPRATLKINNTTIRPGRTLQMRWEIKGATNRIQSVEIALIGYEKDKAMRNTQEMKDLIREFQIFTTTSPMEIERGQTSWKIPQEIRLSEGCGPMDWTLRLRGTISSWPDVYADVKVYIVDYV